MPPLSAPTLPFLLLPESLHPVRSLDRGRDVTQRRCENDGNHDLLHRKLLLAFRARRLRTRRADSQELNVQCSTVEKASVTLRHGSGRCYERLQFSWMRMSMGTYRRPSANGSAASMDSSPHILIVDDDRDIRDLLSRFLRNNGYRVDTVADGREMKRVLETAGIDLIVLDRVLPGTDGLTLCREVRAHSRVPVILLTLLGGEVDRILGLEVGADDYLAKPFSPQELLARIRAVLRRSNDLPLQSRLQNSPILRFAGWSLDRNRRRLESPDRVIVTLTDGEFDLLVALAEHPRVVLSRQQLLDLARGRNEKIFDRSIDMQVTRLRRKIEENPDDPQLIKTIRSKGYVFTPEVSGGSA